MNRIVVWALLAGVATAWPVAGESGQPFAGMPARKEKVSGTVYLLFRAPLRSKSAFKPQSFDHPFRSTLITIRKASKYAAPELG